MRLGDEELMAMFSAGMTQAFDMLFERYRHRVYRFALACLRNPADAQDAVQETFIRIARSAPRYQPRGRFKPWIFQISANCIRTAAARMQNFQEDPGDFLDAPAQNPAPDQQLIGRDLLLKSLAQLPDQQRMILLLKEVEGLSCRAIADALDLTAANVRVLMHRARKQMLAFVAEDIKGDSHDTQ